MNLVDQLWAHAQRSGYESLPAATRTAAITFITDSVAVGLAGSRHARRPQLQQAVAAWGVGDDACEWISGARHTAGNAALLNAWQIHNQEFDCVHERAVVHPMAAILPALLAVAERCGQQGRPVGGEGLIAALVLAVDVAATLGSAQVAPMRFFRPAMCGCLGATLGLARLLALDEVATANALGIAYSQLAGTMQAHLEGSPMLALQVGLAARAAVTAIDLALAGFSGPRDVLQGPFGYFDLFDAPLAPRRVEVQAVFDELQQVSRICEVSHKPFPTGRAAHGALDGLGLLREQHTFAADDVVQIELAAPPLILRLVDRPIKADMDVNYARLCLPYLAATFLLRGTVGLQDFGRAALDDPERQRLAQRVSCLPNATTNPNALAPQTLNLSLRSGARHRVELPAVLGHPDRPLSPLAQRAKFDACCDFAGLPPAASATLHAACQALAGCADVRSFTALMRAPELLPPP